MGLKKSLRRLLNVSTGLDIVRYSPTSSELSWWITRCDTDLVLDVGANVGQFASGLFKMGYRGRVVSFEPGSSEHEKLTKAARSNRRWEVAERCALGDHNGEIELLLSRDSISNSALAPTNRLSRSSPGSECIGSERTALRRLTDITASYIKEARSPFLKIDVQGFEDRVLAGAEEILPRINGLEIEMSFVPLYENQVLFEDMMKRIREYGFYLHTLQPFFRGETGQDMQADALFFREGYAPSK